MAPINLKPSSKGVTALITVAAILFIGCALAYVGASKKLSQAAGELEAKTKQVNDSEQIAQKLEKSKLEYVDAQSQLRNLETSVSTQAYVPTLLKQLEYLGKSTNLKVLGVRPEEAKKQAAAAPPPSSSSGTTPDPNAAVVKEAPKPYDELVVELEAEGNYMNVLDFIYKLTSFPKIMLVNSVDISPATQVKGIGSPNLSIKMNITAFIMKGENSGTQTKTEVSSAGRSGNDAG